MIEFRDVDVERQRAVQAAVVQAVMPFKANTEAAILVLALICCARTLLRLYPKGTQQQLLAAILPFLQGSTQGPAEDESRTESGLILPPGTVLH